MDCQFCDEVIVYTDPSIPPLYNQSGEPLNYHRECMLREVTGGIGHLMAHPYWCVQQHDPDGGLTRHQSSQMVMHLANVIGTDAMVARFPDTSDLQREEVSDVDPEPSR